jgi:hypothetical protein
MRNLLSEGFGKFLWNSLLSGSELPIEGDKSMPRKESIPDFHNED